MITQRDNPSNKGYASTAFTHYSLPLNVRFGPG